MFVCFLIFGPHPAVSGVTPGPGLRSHSRQVRGTIWDAGNQAQVCPGSTKCKANALMLCHLSDPLGYFFFKVINILFLVSYFLRNTHTSMYMHLKHNFKNIHLGCVKWMTENSFCVKHVQSPRLAPGPIFSAWLFLVSRQWFPRVWPTASFQDSDMETWHSKLTDGRLECLSSCCLLE